MLSHKTIFIAALDWGMGHATRCVPLIKELKRNNTVLLGVSPLTKIIFDEEFPDLKQISLPSYNISYSNKLPLWMKLALDAPRITRIINEENSLLNKIIDEYKIDVVISDNRFGLYSERVRTVFISHQLFLKTPVFEGLANKINKNYILRFNEVWIPDQEKEKESLSGELSHGQHYHNNVKYIGPQSRLSDIDVPYETGKFDYLILLSGPEPQRTLLENSLLKAVSKSNKRVALARGTENKNPGLDTYGSSVEIHDLPSKEKLKSLILSSNKIICRSGYSTLMDTYLMNKKDLILIPTPGQSEQEYLARYWHKKINSTVIDQNHIQHFKL